MELADVLRGDLRHCRPRRLYPGGEGQTCRDEGEAILQVSHVDNDDDVT